MDKKQLLTQKLKQGPKQQQPNNKIGKKVHIDTRTMY